MLRNSEFARMRPPNGVLLLQNQKNRIGDVLNRLEGRHETPTIGTIQNILNSCKREGNSVDVMRLFGYMRKNELDGHVLLGNDLVQLLVQVGNIRSAQRVFDKLPSRKESSWNSLIIGYSEHGELYHAVILYRKLQNSGVDASIYTYIALIKACANIKDAQTGQELHAEVLRKGLEKDVFISSSLICMYSKCGWLMKAREVLLNKRHIHDVVSWNALIGGYNKQCFGKDALNCFKQMQQNCISPNSVTYVFALKACGLVGDPCSGHEIHMEVFKKGLLEKDVSVGSTLVEMYCCSELLVTARYVFDTLPIRDVYSWNALLAGYLNHECEEIVLECFDEMLTQGIFPDAVTYVCALKACASIEALDKGRELHGDIERKVSLQKNIIIANALVDMYANCGWLMKSKEVFDAIIDRDVISWTSLITGYVKFGHNKEAISFLDLMQQEGVSPDSGTFVCCLKACGNLVHNGEYVHDEIVKRGLETDILIGNALIDMYVNCGFLHNAQEVFNKLLVRDVISWTTLVGGHVKQGDNRETFNCLLEMQAEGIAPNVYTLIFCLKSCGNIGAGEKGYEIHVDITKKGLLKGCTFLCSALVDMYVSCGLLVEALEVFEHLAVGDDICWTIIMNGYAQSGNIDRVISMFGKMQIEEIMPNGATFQTALNACSHAGFLECGLTCFEIMMEVYDMNPTIEHYTSLIDLFGRAGQVENMAAIVDRMPFHPNIVTWHAVLGACRKWGNVLAGLHAFQQAVEMFESDDAAYFCMFNIYMDAEMHIDARNIDILRLQRQLDVPNCQYSSFMFETHS